jgi:hypothetical protein
LSDVTFQNIAEITFGRVYIAKDGGYVVGIVIDGRGRNTILTEETDALGEVHYEIYYYDYNQPVNITPPEGCDPPGEATSGFPIPEGVSDLLSFPGLTSFSSTMSVEELTEYYKTEMVAAGWTLDSDTSFTGLSTLMFSKDGKQATVLISSDQATGNSLVAITEAP